MALTVGSTLQDPLPGIELPLCDGEIKAVDVS
jgi:hypothetical protein